jgi:hypothetical protein
VDLAVTAITPEAFLFQLAGKLPETRLSLPPSVVGTWYFQGAHEKANYWHATMTIHDAQFSVPGDLNLDIRVNKSYGHAQVNCQLIINYKFILLSVPSGVTFVLRPKCVDCKASNYEPHNVTILCPEDGGCPTYGDRLFTIKSPTELTSQNETYTHNKPW